MYIILLLVKRISNSLCIQWGIYNPSATTGTVSFSVTFTVVYGIVGRVDSSVTNNMSYNRLPYNLTVSGFTRANGNVSSDKGYYLAWGKK